MLIKVLIFVCWLVYSVNSSGKNETGLDPTGENVCTRTIKYFVNKTQLYMRQVLVPYYDCDGISIFGDCPFWAQTKKFRSESKSSVKNVLVVRTKNISECCPGYQQYNSSCPTGGYVCYGGLLKVLFLDKSDIDIAYSSILFYKLFDIELTRMWSKIGQKE
eukprot:TCONS_00028847-protein